MSDQSTFLFGPKKWGLFGNALNEVIHGFNVLDFERIIGSESARWSNSLSVFIRCILGKS